VKRLRFDIPAEKRQAVLVEMQIMNGEGNNARRRTSLQPFSEQWRRERSEMMKVGTLFQE